ncbi:hypothetical protein ACA910_013516 [Epithemia clementina (nom. ined.)]
MLSTRRQDTWLTKTLLVFRLTSLFSALLASDVALAWTVSRSGAVSLTKGSNVHGCHQQPLEIRSLAVQQQQPGRFHLTHFSAGKSAVRNGSHFHRRTSTCRSAVAVVDTDSSSLSASEAEISPIQEQMSTSADLVFASSSEIEEDRQETWSKVINGLFLAVCFGVAIGSLLSIDQGMTRGWTQSEIALRLPLDAWTSYEAALEESPVATKTMINVVIYLLGDWLSQTVFAKHNILDFDLGRTLRNGFIGLCFGPLVHEYYQFSDTILPVDGGLGNRVCKIMMDQSIYLVVKCSMYIMAVNTLQGQNFETSTRAVKEKIGGIVFTAWKFWPLIHCITYSVIPARHRILWVNCVDLVWNAILASMSQTKATDAEQLEAQEQVALKADAIDVLEVMPSTSIASTNEKDGVHHHENSPLHKSNPVLSGVVADVNYAEKTDN